MDENSKVFNANHQIVSIDWTKTKESKAERESESCKIKGKFGDMIQFVYSHFEKYLLVFVFEGCQAS